MFYFAYGANLSRRAMNERAPEAGLVGRAVLPGWRFAIAASGWATIVADPAASVEGALWRLSSADLARLDEFEGVPEGLYRRETVRVTSGTRELDALAYIESYGGTGTPQPGYLDQILAAGRELGLPDGYLREISGWR